MYAAIAFILMQITIQLDWGPIRLEEPKPAPKATVCQCEGYKEHLCLCLKNGQKCHCTPKSGSVWQVDGHGKGTKTGAKAELDHIADVNKMVPQPPVIDVDDRPVLIVYSPATWHCPWCDVYLQRNWSTTPFRIEHKHQDGFPSYPRTEWVGKDGKTHVLQRAYSPEQVEWSWNKTME